jgi:predicted GNAT family acetyltransferase
VPVDDAHVARRLGDDLLWLWDDGGPRSLVGCGGYTTTGARIGPVYTPREHRGRGYASAATAAVSGLLLRERGRALCFLYTDLANPTSNKIYQAIGYEHVADVREIAFAG